MSILDIGLFLKVILILNAFSPMIILIFVYGTNTMLPGIFSLKIIADLLNKILPKLSHALTAFSLGIVM